MNPPLPRVVPDAHLGSATQENRRRIAELSIENLLAGLRGEPLLHLVVHVVESTKGNVTK